MRMSTALLIALVAAGSPRAVFGQSAPTPDAPRISIVVGVGSIDPAPYWQGGWTTHSGEEHADRTPELSASVRIPLSHRKSLDFGFSRWHVRISNGADPQTPGYIESHREVQEVRAFEANWIKRFGRGRTSFFAGGGAAISKERREETGFFSTCQGGIPTCSTYDLRSHHVTTLGQGLAGIETIVNDRVTAFVSYRAQARGVGGFEFGGMYHGITGGLAIGIR